MDGHSGGVGASASLTSTSLGDVAAVGNSGGEERRLGLQPDMEISDANQQRIVVPNSSNDASWLSLQRRLHVVTLPP